jgi:general secretion pathway protein E
MIIRFRIDGILYLILTLDLNIFPLIATILKLFSNLDISQIRLPQNGRFTKILDKKEYDFRLSTIPIIDGESLVLRVLDNKNSKITLDKIGFDKYIFKALNKIINLNQGLILVTGPTGSGKTTSMYAMLNTLNTNSKKIITVEDPVEYNLDGIQQININEDLDLTYSYALKSILRQDPDIIMIGEIRDEEALKIAIQAALTGHLVIATLHTNNAPDTINRLLDLNAEPFLIASTLKAVISQRLIRKLCNNCKDNQAKNCEVCNNTRYQGRINICELLECDKTVSNMIANSDSIPNIIKYVTTKNYITLEQNCLNKVKNGITSMEEYYSKIQSI